jgi:hypothetical protein
MVGWSATGFLFAHIAFPKTPLGLSDLLTSIAVTVATTIGFAPRVSVENPTLAHDTERVSKLRKEPNNKGAAHNGL